MKFKFLAWLSSSEITCVSFLKFVIFFYIELFSICCLPAHTDEIPITFIWIIFWSSLSSSDRVETFFYCALTALTPYVCSVTLNCLLLIVLILPCPMTDVLLYHQNMSQVLLCGCREWTIDQLLIQELLTKDF